VGNVRFRSTDRIGRYPLTEDRPQCSMSISVDCIQQTSDRLLAAAEINELIEL
jgi:hypothetical protein